MRRASASPSLPAPRKAPAVWLHLHFSLPNNEISHEFPEVVQDANSGRMCQDVMERGGGGRGSALVTNSRDQNGKENDYRFLLEMRLLAQRNMDLSSSEESEMRPLKGNFPLSGIRAQTFHEETENGVGQG